MKLKISERLMEMARLVPAGARVADIGTDHGLLPIYLVSEGLSPHVILSDVRPGPLEKARKNLALFKADEYCSVRMGDGLTTLMPGEADAVVIAGMGGMLISGILGADPQLTGSFSRFILQPRRDAVKLRQWLIMNNFKILDEVLVREGRNICEIISAIPGSETENVHEHDADEYDVDEFEFSPMLIKRNGPLFMEFIRRKISIEKKNLERIEKAAAEHRRADAGMRRRSEILERIDKMQDLLERAEGSVCNNTEETSGEGTTHGDHDR